MADTLTRVHHGFKIVSRQIPPLAPEQLSREERQARKRQRKADAGVIDQPKAPANDGWLHDVYAPTKFTDTPDGPRATEWAATAAATDLPFYSQAIALAKKATKAAALPKDAPAPAATAKPTA